MILYCALFLPYISYCCEVWGNTYRTTINSIYILQKLSMRIVCGVSYLHHSNVLFLELHVLKLFDLIEFKIDLILYKACNRRLPGNIQTMFNVNIERIHITRQSKNIRHVFARTTQKANCITVCGIKLWNRLPANIRTSHNIYTFKKLFKKIVFAKYVTLL